MIPDQAIVEGTSLPTVTRNQMRAVDEHAVEELGPPLVAMMENAGRNLAQATRALFPDAATIAVLAGKGHNGGGGLAAARHLTNAGHEVRVHLTHPVGQARGATRRQARVLEQSGVTIREPPTLPQLDETDVAVDAILGYNQHGAPRGRVATLADRADGSEVPVIALDVPTGLDPDLGTWQTPAVQPAATLTLALPNRGLARADPPPGRVLVADIGIPTSALPNVEESIFDRGPIVEFNETHMNDPRPT